MANSIKNNVIFVDTTGVVYTGGARVVAVAVKAGSTVASVILRDDSGGTGQKLVSVGDVAINGFDGIVTKAIFKDVIHATIAGTGAEAYIYLD